MYERILVPLDGSKVAEAVLPSVAWLARGLGAQVTLLNVAEPLHRQGGVHPIRRFRLANINILEETAETEQKVYLHGVVKWLGKRRVAATPVVVTGDASREIVDQAEKYGCDLVAMSTRGRSGLGRTVLGSVTDAVIRSSRLPILVAGPKGSGEPQAEGTRVERVLVPLDGSPLAEMALLYVEEMATRLSLELILIRVVESPAWTHDGERLHPAVASFMEKELETRAAEYLETTAGKLRGKGISTQCSVLSGNPAPAIVNHVQATESAMVAIATHGRSGLGRLLAGSVAGTVIRSLHTPVLVVPPIQRSGEGSLSLAHHSAEK